MSDRTKTDEAVLDDIARLHLGEMDYDNPTDALESISLLVSATGREIEGWPEDE